MAIIPAILGEYYLCSKKRLMEADDRTDWALTTALSHQVVKKPVFLTLSGYVPPTTDKAIL